MARGACPIRASQKWRVGLGPLGQSKAARGRPIGAPRPARLRHRRRRQPHSRSAGKRGNMSENQVREWDGAVYKKILIPIDLADPDLAKPAVATALMMAGPSEGMIRFVNVLPLTPVMLPDYVPPHFEGPQRKAAEDAPAIVRQENRLPPARVSS